METISNHQADESASTRIAVWGWTWDYAKNNPLGGGFEAYRQNRLRVQTSGAVDLGSVQLLDRQVLEDRGRAYHSSYFEMLGEQGFPGLILWLMIHGGGLLRMEVLRRRYRGVEGDDAWIAPLATALQHAQIIYLVGSVFVGIAFQPFMFMLLAVQIGFDNVVSRRGRAGKAQPFRRPPRQAPAAA
jgi:O-antigen ligase